MFKKALKLAFILTLISIVLPRSSYAYLDPGTGSYLIQIIIASVAGFGYLVKANWVKIRKVLFKKDRKGVVNENGDKLS